MARKKKQADPAGDPADPTMTGFPQHGDPAPGDGDPPVIENRDSGDEDDPQDDDPPNELDELKSRLAQQEQELAHLRRQTPPVTPKEPAAPTKDAYDEVEELLYKDPKAALKKHGELVAQQVSQQLTSRYERDKGQQQFWNQFYDAHKDLKSDADLVELTLKSNLNELANIPINDAMTKLADLTRDRILRYAGKDKQRSKKAQAEGSSPPAPQAQEPPVEKPPSLVDIIKKRRDARRGTVAA